MVQPGWHRFLESKEAQFWALQFAGWSGWAVAGSISWMYWMPDSPYAQVYALASLVGVVISSGLRHAYRAIWRWPMASRVAGAVALSYAAGGIWQVGKNLILLEFMPHDTKIGEGWLGYLEGITSSFYIMVTWSGLYFGIKWYQLLQAESAKVLRISAMAHQAQLRMLRYQLNPHFLFNTLNAISTLILERDTDRANGMVTRLSKFLRYSLDSDPIGKVSLAQEIDALRLYLDIEQVRFGDRLTLDVAVEEAASRALIPSLLLQPLVENAIKYAIAPNESGGTIRLRANTTRDWLEIEVSDEGPGITKLGSAQTNGARGVGLANTRDRLNEIYGDAHRFEIANRSPRGLSIVIRVPFEVAV
jgi:two-component system, LytTR family, sensor kinase